MRLHELKSPPGATRPLNVLAGVWVRHGKTSTRGHKGQKAVLEVGSARIRRWADAAAKTLAQAGIYEYI